MTEKIYAKKWVERAISEQDYFDKFVYAYFALNALYNRFYKKSERQAIWDLFDYCYFKYPSFKFKMRDISETKEFKYFMDRRAIRNCRYKLGVEGTGYPDTEREKQMLFDSHWAKKNKAMLSIIYQIRCNLFHGNKQFSSENDSEIMKNASVLLVEYMKAFICEEY